ncbi:hypothetical protein [Chitinophaga agrisoli]|uniref:hypothetical protein n=1 Tax=Chitinophaga agrisoli TaxID=2607653 RepID=UPI001BC942EF|nr:hypothetical protein [Chitinophaga agrisoli]
MKRLIYLSAFFLVCSACSKKGTNDSPKDDNNNNDNNTACAASLADIESIMLFPADNPLNKDISALPVDPNSTAILSAYAGTGLKADFGSGLWEGAPIGIPFTVVCGSQPKIPVTFRGNDYDDNYGDESDPGPYPIPLNTPIEGNGEGDSHVIAVDKENGMLYELYNASVNGNHWEASSGAVFNLKSNQLRQEGWTSADAAGLPILTGLVRYEEVLKGTIDHAIRFTLSKPNIKPAYILPARHKVNSTGGANSLPMGGRIRLKAGFNISAYPARIQVILTAMKKYGLILADVGSNMYVSGAPDNRWNNDELQQLGKVKASDFEVVKTN